MTLAEALAQGLSTTVIGLVIVFGVLLILMAILMLMKVVFYKDPNKTAAVNSNTTAPAAEIKTETAAKDDDMDESELVAVLTAAIAASLNTSTYNLKIKSFKRVGNNSPAWNKAGLNDVINSRF